MGSDKRSRGARARARGAGSAEAGRGAGATPERKPVAEKPADFDKLPRRFRDYIRALENRLWTLEAVVKEQKESRCWLATYSPDGERRFLPDDARVQFQTKHGIVEARLDQRRGNGGIEVSSPDGRMLVLSEASNEIGIRVGRTFFGEDA